MSGPGQEGGDAGPGRARPARPGGRMLAVARRLVAGPWRGVDLTPELARLTRRAPTEEQVNQWALTLAARGIPYRLVPASPWPRLYVSRRWRKAALQETTADPREIEEPHAPKARISALPNAHITLFLFFLLLVFHGLTSGWWLHLPAHETWVDLGALNAGRMWAYGEWYRAVTALWLHMDSLHVFSNVVFGSVIMIMLCRRLGVGLGWLSVAAAGTMGNAAMALVRRADYVSLGFSTAVFGGVGVLCGSMMALFGNRKHVLAPLAVGLAWLALMGSGSEEFGRQADIGAHAMGFVMGLPLGWAAGAYVRGHGPPGPKASAFWLGVSVFFVAAAWHAALNSA